MMQRFKTTVILLALGATVPARSATPDAAPAYSVEMRIAMHGEDTAPRLVTHANEVFAVAGAHAGKPWRVEFTLAPTDAANRVRLAGKITEDGRVLAAPVLVGALGEPVGVRIGDDVRVALTVRPGS